MNEKDEILYAHFLKTRSEEDLMLLLERHRDALTLFLYGYVHNMEDAEELMIDSFAEVAAGRNIFAGRSSFKTWLFAVAHNLARMHMRKHRPDTVPIEDVSEIADERGTIDGPETALLKNERNRKLYAAIKKLDPQAGQVLKLIYFEDMSYDEVARVIGKSRRQTYKYAELCRNKLKKILENETDIEL